MIRRYLIGSLILAFVYSGCEKSNSLCGGKSPAQDLPWLKAEIARLSQSPQCQSVARSTYKDRTVFIVSNCEQGATAIPHLYDCDGKTLNLTPVEYQNLQFTGEIEVVWRSR